MTASTEIQSLTEELRVVHAACLSMNDTFLAEAALFSRELLADLAQKHCVTVDELTAEDIILELRQRDLRINSSPSPIKFTKWLRSDSRPG